MTLPKYTIGGRYRGQPDLPGVAVVPDVLVDGLETASLRESARVHVLPRLAGIRDVILCHERPSDWDTAKVADLAAYLYEMAGATGWWYGWGIADSAVCGQLRDVDPARYKAWLAALRSFRLPTGVNFAYDLYQQVGESAEAWFVNRSEYAKALRESLPDARILPIVWHRMNQPPYPLMPVAMFRAMIRFAVREHGRVRWWIDPLQDAQAEWNPLGVDVQSPYQAAFLEESGAYR